MAGFGWDEWFSNLMKAAFAAPIYFFLLLLVTFIVDIDIVPKNTTNMSAGIILVLVMIQCAIVITLLLKATKIVESASGEIGGMILKGTKVIAGGAAGLVGGAALGGLALAGQGTVGWVGKKIGESARLTRWATNGAGVKNNFLNVLKASGNKALSVDATIYNNAGANSVTELACTIAQVNEYLNLLAEQNKLNEAAQLTINVSADTNFFEQIAKLRALRNLVNLLLEQYNSNLSLHIHCETSDIYRSAFDSYSNLLRDSISGMAAVIGNCDSLSIHHFNDKSEDNKLATRMSRNQQLIFKEESYLDKVNDISNGSYYIETLTNELATKAWEEFKQIEKAGGFIASVLNGNIKAKIEEQAFNLVNEYKEGKRTLIGVNKFPNANDKPEKLADTKKNKGINKLSLTAALV